LLCLGELNSLEIGEELAHENGVTFSTPK
jgi:hypothetical protein